MTAETLVTVIEFSFHTIILLEMPTTMESFSPPTVYCFLSGQLYDSHDGRGAKLLCTVSVNNKTRRCVTTTCIWLAWQTRQTREFRWQTTKVMVVGPFFFCLTFFNAARLARVMHTFIVLHGNMQRVYLITLIGCHDTNTRSVSGQSFMQSSRRTV